MGRKRNQGKARRAAKAKARKAAEERGNNQTTKTEERLTAAQIQRLGDRNLLPTSIHDTILCRHGFNGFDNDVFIDFREAFIDAFHEAIDKGAHVMKSLVEVRHATMDEYADVWNDCTKLKTAVSYFLCVGTQHILDSDYVGAGGFAIFVRYLEQHIAVYLNQTVALFNIPIIDQTLQADHHTLVKFFRHRIPCSCLDEKYEKVKSITKMGVCYNPDCNSLRVERCKTMYCSRCRCVTYCSRKCQEADLRTHKPLCDQAAAIRAEFEAKKKS